MVDDFSQKIDLKESAFILQYGTASRKKLSDKRFEMLLADYEAEQCELELSVEAMERSLNKYQEKMRIL